MEGLSPEMTNTVRVLWRGDEQLPELIEAAEAVERLMASPGWQHVQRVLAERIERIDYDLETSDGWEAADYAKRVGERRALRSQADAARAIVAVAAKARERAEKQVKDAGESASERVVV